jgi:hypothetical protein
MFAYRSWLNYKLNHVYLDKSFHLFEDENLPDIDNKNVRRIRPHRHEHILLC